MQNCAVTDACADASARRTRQRCVCAEEKDAQIPMGCRFPIIHAGGTQMKFYTIKLPKFLGGFVKAILNTFNKN
jgi:stage V sporulation protein M